MKDVTTKKRWRWRRLIQFRLRTVIGLMVVVSFALAFWRSHIKPYREQKAALEALGKKVEFVSTAPGEPFWLRPFYKKDEFQDVVHLSFLNHYEFKEQDAVHLRKFHRLQKLSLQGTYLQNAGVANLAGLKQLEKLALKRLRITDDALAYLEGLRNLRVLHLSYSPIEGDGLKHIAGLTDLVELELDEVRIRDEHLSHILKLKNLRTLSLDCTNLSAAALQQLSTLPYLRELTLRTINIPELDLVGFPSIEKLHVIPYTTKRLHIEGMHRLDELAIYSYRQQGGLDLALVDLPNLSKYKIAFPRISRLRMENLPRFKSLGLANTNLRHANFRDMPNVTEVNLDSSCINESVLQALSKLPSLQSLSLERAFSSDNLFTPASRISPTMRRPLTSKHMSRLALARQLRSLNLNRTNIDDLAVNWLRPLQNLTKLGLRGNNVSDDGIDVVRRFENLEVLDISGTPISDRSLATLSELAGLTRLYLSNTAISDDGLKHLADLLVLRDLHLDSTRISDKGLGVLSRFNSLTGLFLSDTNVTLDGLAHLYGMPKLVKLVMPNRQMTDADWRRIEKLLPDTSIHVPEI